jgi:hypothetical protein
METAMKKSRIMYVEQKGDQISGPARIGRVRYSKTGKSLYYRGRMFQSQKGSGFKSNFFDTETGEAYWISGCKKDGTDSLYSGTVEIDEDVREEYWRDIRGSQKKQRGSSIRDIGKYSR